MNMRDRGVLKKLTLLLAVVSGTAAAEWAEIGASEIATTYADPAAVQKAGDLAKMWDLLDFKAVQSRPYGTPYMSQKTRQEYDCRDPRVRILDVLRYAENMGKGEEVRIDADPEEWKPVPAGSTAATLREVACGKR